MNFGIKDKRKPEISIIPVINVVFLLIIFFLLTGNMEKQDVLPINAPISQNGKSLPSSQVEILVSTNELIYNLELISEENLLSLVQEAVKKNPNLEITLKADAELDSRKLLNILKILKHSGAKNLYLVTASAK